MSNKYTEKMHCLEMFISENKQKVRSFFFMIVNKSLTWGTETG